MVKEGPPPSWDRGLKGGGEGRVGWVEEEEEAVKGLDSRTAAVRGEGSAIWRPVGGPALLSGVEAGPSFDVM